MKIEILAVLVVIYLLNCVLLSKRRQGNTEAAATAGAGRELRFGERLVAMLQLSKRVTTTLYAKIGDAFPSSYRDALRLPTQIDDLVETVQQHADHAKSEYGVNVPAVERTLQDEETRIKKLNELKPDLRIEATGRQSVPASATYNQVEAAKSAFGRARMTRELSSSAKDRRR